LREIHYGYISWMNPNNEWLQKRLEGIGLR
jgi:hypothetical protein